MHGRKALYVLLTLTFSSQFNSNVIAANLYELTDLGPLNITDQQAQNLNIKINQNKEVIGWSRSGSKMLGFTWSSDAGLVQPLADSNANQFLAINNSAQVIGYVEDGNGLKQASLWEFDFNNSQSLGTLGGDSSIPYAINNSRVIVGQSKDASDVERAFIWSNNAMTPLLPTAASSKAEDINDSNWVTGQIFDNGVSQAFIWDKAELVKLNDIDANVYSSWASQINNQNQVIGGMVVSTDGTGDPRYMRTYAYAWSKQDGITNLGLLIEGISWALANNASNQIVGGRLNNLRDRHAILWEQGVAYNLNALTQNTSIWKLLDATDINNAGDIVGIADVSGSYRAFLLTPVVASVPTADLSIEISNVVAPDVRTKPGSRSLTLDSSQQLIVEVINQGPDDGTNVTFEIELSKELNVTSLVANAAECVKNTLVIDCQLETLAVNAKEQLVIDMTNVSEGAIDITAAVSADEPDAGANINNQLSETIIVSKPKTAVVNDVPDNTANDDPENAQTDNNGGEDTENQSTVPPSSSFSSGSSGCSMGHAQRFDPMLWLLLVLAVIGIKTNKQKI